MHHKHIASYKLGKAMSLPILLLWYLISFGYTWWNGHPVGLGNCAAKFEQTPPYWDHLEWEEQRDLLWKNECCWSRKGKKQCWDPVTQEKEWWD